MKQEYKIEKSVKVFACIFFPACIVCFAFLSVIPFIEYKFNPVHALFYIIITVILEALMIIGLLLTLKSRIVIEHERIISTGIFKSKSLALNEISGFRKDGHFLQFIPFNKNLDKIYASPFLEDYNKLAAWAEKNLKDLESEKIESDENDIFKNAEFGLTLEDRKLCLSRWKRSVSLMNAFSLIAAVSLWFYPHFYKTQIIICCILPALGLAVIQFSNGLVIISEKRDSVRPDISTTLLVPSIALLVSALSEYNVLNYSNFMKPGIAVFALTLFILLKSWNSRNKNITTYLILIYIFLTAIIYTYGLIITTNAVFDKSSAEVFRVKVLEKRISSGKGKSYYLTLESWGPQKEIKDLQVSEVIYNGKKKGDYAVVHLLKGLYNIPYYMIVK